MFILTQNKSIIINSASIECVMVPYPNTQDSEGKVNIYAQSGTSKYNLGKYSSPEIAARILKDIKDNMSLGQNYDMPKDDYTVQDWENAYNDMLKHKHKEEK